MVIVGHRGARGLAPENTLASIKAALAAGAQAIEIDVRVTKDGVPVLSHDVNDIHSSNYDQLRLTTLREAIGFVNRQVPLHIEIKRKEQIGPIVYTVKSFLDEGWQPEDFRYLSFSQRTLRELHTAMPEITLVVNEEWSSLRAVQRMKALDTKHVNMNCHVIWFGFVRAMRNRGYVLGTYTLNRPRRARWLQQFGLDAIYTDFPDRFIK